MGGSEHGGEFNYPPGTFKLPVIHFVTPMSTVRHLKTGEEVRVWPVDAREYEASGQWEIVEPKP